MGYKELTLKLGAEYTDEELNSVISKKLGIKKYLYHLKRKSLDARKRSNIHWQITVGVSSIEINTSQEYKIVPSLTIDYKKRNKKIVVVGSGPAGFFSAFVLQKSGFDVTLLERGASVSKRAKGIENFEKTGEFNAASNYAFGEGGAGTFSDGKLTSRSKHILQERQFIIDSYISAGAPAEIAYLAHPHIGSDNLRVIVKKLRADFINEGGKICFETMVKDLKVVDGKVISVVTEDQELPVDMVILATGHSAYETYKMLIDKGVTFKPKNFAVGCRLEHEQELINLSQWGHKKLTGISAAEYRLSTQVSNDMSVYTFCMCPGGSIIPANAYEKRSVVNGMSMYSRNGRFANAGCVAGVDLNKLMKKEITALEAINWLDDLEKNFYDQTQGYILPACSIQEFVKKKTSNKSMQTSYPLGITKASLWEMLPANISDALVDGLQIFSKKIRGFEKGNIMGLESKTSAIVQVLRDQNGLCEGFSNLYMVGEGSGYAGGIISSAADGIRASKSISEIF